MKEDITSSAITISNLTVGYPETHHDTGFVRTNINYSASSGEMIALIGPNGTGKSTLLRTMAGFHGIMAGEISYHGRPLCRYNPRELSQMISFVSTENIQVSNMRVADLVAYGRFPYTNWLGKLNARDKELVMTALHNVGMASFARRMVTQLSDGERQRVLIARALAQDTPFILLDEPTAFLDVSNKYEIFHLLHRLARQYNKTIVLSTHDLNIAMREMDKFWILLDNESLEGSPEDAVLKGWLDRLFATGNIAFDTSSGDFYFQKEHAGTASVSGPEPAFSWTIRALERRGFFFTMKSDAQVRIRIVPGPSAAGFIWEIKTLNRTWRVDSVYELFNTIGNNDF